DLQFVDRFGECDGRNKQFEAGDPVGNRVTLQLPKEQISEATRLLGQKLKRCPRIDQDRLKFHGLQHSTIVKKPNSTISDGELTLRESAPDWVASEICIRLCYRHLLGKVESKSFFADAGSRPQGQPQRAVRDGALKTITSIYRCSSLYTCRTRVDDRRA